MIPRWTNHLQVPEELLHRSEEFSKIIPKNDLVLVMGDSTPNVYLYYLARKGMVKNDFKSTESGLQTLRSRGFRWLIYRGDDAGDATTPSGMVLSANIGSFRVYRITSESKTEGSDSYGNSG